MSLKEVDHNSHHRTVLECPMLSLRPVRYNMVDSDVFEHD